MTKTKLKLNRIRIDNELLRMGLNQAQFADQNGISRQYLNYMLQAPVSIKNAETLAYLFNVYPKDLLIGDTNDLCTCDAPRIGMKDFCTVCGRNIR